MSEKKELDLGNPGTAWKSEHNETLEISLKELYGGHLPYSYSEKDIKITFFQHYNSKRSQRSVWGQLISILSNKRVTLHQKKSPPYYKGIKIYSIREWYEIDGYSDDKVDILKKKYIVKSNKKTYSIIGLSQIEDCLYYIYPTVLDADYAEIFYDALTCPSEDPESQKRLDKDRDSKTLFEPHSNNIIEVPFKSKDSILYTSVYFLLDFLLSNLARKIKQLDNTQGKYKDNKVFQGDIENFIQSFESFGYKYSQKEKLYADISDAIKLNKQLKTIKDDSTFSSLKQIADNSDMEYAKIPEYKISMSKVFELYVFSIIKDDMSKETIKYQDNIIHSKEKDEKDEKEVKPDLTVVGDSIAIDAKYKFQFITGDTIPLEDTNRMIEYLFQLNKKKESAIKPRGYFVFPCVKCDVDFKPLDKDLHLDEYLTMVYVQLPINDNFYRGRPSNMLKR